MLPSLEEYNQIEINSLKQKLKKAEDLIDSTKTLITSCTKKTDDEDERTAMYFLLVASLMTKFDMHN